MSRPVGKSTVPDSRVLQMLCRWQVIYFASYDTTGKTVRRIISYDEPYAVHGDNVIRSTNIERCCCYFCCCRVARRALYRDILGTA